MSSHAPRYLSPLVSQSVSFPRLAVDICVQLGCEACVPAKGRANSKWTNRLWSLANLRLRRDLSDGPNLNNNWQCDTQPTARRAELGGCASQGLIASQSGPSARLTR